MDTIDLKKQLKDFYEPTDRQVVEVDVPARNFLMIDGSGDPNTSPDYAAAVEALFGVSYAAKCLVKKSELAIDYGVMPLEGLWWADNLAAFSTGDKCSWQWTAMVMQPQFVSPDLIAQAMEQTRQRKASAALGQLRFEEFAEGRCAQLLHVGPFADEGPSIEKLHHYIAAKGRLVGKHHEIYLSDIRLAAPAAWKTIIRQPMA